MKIKVLGTGTSAEIGKWVGLAKKRIKFLRKFRLKNKVSLKDRLNIAGAEITMLIRRTGIDEVLIKPGQVAGYTIRGWLTRTTGASFTSSSLPDISGINIALSQRKVITEFAVGEGLEEPIETVGLPVLASSCSYSERLFDTSVPQTNSELVSIALSKQFESFAIPILHAYNWTSPFLGGWGLGIGLLVIRRLDLPAYLQSLLTSDLVLSQDRLRVIHGTTYATYLPNPSSDLHVFDPVGLFNYGFSIEFIAATVPISNLPHTWAAPYETVALLNHPIGSTVQINPATGLVFDLPTPASNLPSGTYFEDGSRVPEPSENSVEVEEYFGIVERIVGVDNGDGTITGTLRYIIRLTDLSFTITTLRFTTEFYVQDLRQLVNPSNPDEVLPHAQSNLAFGNLGGGLKISTYWYEETRTPVTVSTGIDDFPTISYFSVLRKRRFCRIDADAYYGIYATFQQETQSYYETSTRAGQKFFGRIIEVRQAEFDPEENEIGQLGFLWDQSETRTTTEYFAHRFVFDLETMLFSVGEALPSHDMSVGGWTSSAGASDSSLNRTAEQHATATGRKIVKAAIDGTLYQFSESTLDYSYDRLPNSGTPSNREPSESGIWEVVSAYPAMLSKQQSSRSTIPGGASLNYCYVFPTTEGMFNVGEITSGLVDRVQRPPAYLDDTLFMEGSWAAPGKGQPLPRVTSSIEVAIPSNDGYVYAGNNYGLSSYTRQGVEIEWSFSVDQFTEQLFTNWGASRSSPGRTETELSMYNSRSNRSPTFGYGGTERAAWLSALPTSNTPYRVGALGNVPAPIGGTSLYVPKMINGRDGIMIAQLNKAIGANTGGDNVVEDQLNLAIVRAAVQEYLDAYAAWEADPTEENLLALRSLYTIHLNNCAPRSLIERYLNHWGLTSGRVVSDHLIIV